MAMPINELTEAGRSMKHGGWTILIARYNYGRYLDHLELSTSPRLPRPVFHQYEDYATLRVGSDGTE